MKKCNVCGEDKPLDMYSKHRSARDGLQSKCKSCSVAIMQKWKLDNKDRYNEYNQSRKLHMRLRLHGIPLEYWEDINTGICAICGSENGSHIDHDHDTTVVRGMLCNGCNSGLGFFADNPDFFRAAAAYLEEPPLSGNGWFSGRGAYADGEGEWRKTRKPRAHSGIKSSKRTARCEKCSAPIYPGGKRCVPCSHEPGYRAYSGSGRAVSDKALGRYNVDWPSLDELVESVNTVGYSATGRKIGVSDNAVRKRIRRLTEVKS